ncbi:hypothetical protein DSBG_4354 [Desulfosporosinus sp. BG]|nr:hypothetical protein DSBG_4354 [Desulfosporosinus sp. BG]
MWSVFAGTGASLFLGGSRIAGGSSAIVAASGFFWSGVSP